MPPLHLARLQHVPSEGPLTGDPELLARAASGDGEAFGAFVVRHRETVWRFARSLTRDTGAAEDALQETFLAAWRNGAGFRGDASALGWLLSIARRAVYRQLRVRVDEPKFLKDNYFLRFQKTSAGAGQTR